MKRFAVCAALTALASSLIGGPAAAEEAPPRVDRAIVILVPHASLDELLAVPGFRSIAAAGGAALMGRVVGPTDPLRRLRRAAEAGEIDLEVVDLGSVAPDIHLEPEALEAAAGYALKAIGVDGMMQVVVMTTPTLETARAEALSPGGVLIGYGPMDRLFDASGEPGTLTSESTRRNGVVAAADLEPTVLAAQDIDPDEAADGSVIRTLDEPPPLELLDRYREAKRLAVPIGTPAALWVIVAGLFCVGVFAFGSRAPRWARLVGAFGGYSVVPLGLAMILGGHLADLTYAVVVPYLLVVTTAASLALLWIARRWGPLGAIVVSGLAGVALLLLETLLGWNSALTSLLGGSQLDGARYFGMPNVAIGLLLGCALYVAHALSDPRAGAALLAACGIVAGLPWLGVNLGASITLFAAAGIWWGLRTAARRRWLRAGIAAAAAAAAGGTLVILANRFLTDAATHIGRFAADSGSAAAVWDRYAERLGVGIDLLIGSPAALIPVVGTPLVLWAVLRPPAALRPSLEAGPAWRDALITICVGAIVAYLANDSGPSALGFGFGTAIGGLFAVALLERAALPTAPPAAEERVSLQPGEVKMEGT